MFSGNYHFIAISVTAGVCIGTGVIHLAIGLRRRRIDALQVTFAVFAITYGLNIIAAIGMYRATTIETFLLATMWNGLFVVVTLISLLWFVALYTAIRPRFFLYGLSGLFIVILGLHTFHPNRLMAEVYGIAFATLPWGEQFAYIEGEETIWLTVFFFAELCLLGFILYAGVRQYRRGERSRAIILLLGVSLLIGTLAFDIFFIESGRINFFFLSDFGFLPMAVMMGVILALHVLQTEVELRKYQQGLEGLVKERTAELADAKAQLEDEVQERRQVEAELRQTNRQIRAMLEAPLESVLLTDPSGIILDLNEIAAQRLGISVDEAIGRNVFDYFEEDVTHRRQDLTSVLVESKKPVRMEDVRESRNYSTVLYPILNDDGDVLNITVFAQDITEQKQADAILRRRFLEMDMLNQIAHSVTSIGDIPSTLQRIAELTTDLFSARFTHIILQETEDEGLMVLNGYDRDHGPIQQFSLDLPFHELTRTKEIFSKGESTILLDAQELDVPSELQNFFRGENIQSILLVPLRVSEEIAGMIAVSRDDPGQAFLPEDISLLEIISSDVSMALENERLQEQELEAAAAEERVRLARDLHDVVTQMIYSAGLIAEALPKVWERNPEEGQLGLSKLRRLIRAALAEMRILLFELRPTAILDASLSGLIQRLVDALVGRTNVDEEMKLEEDCVPPQDVKITLYRIAQEAINNIERHSEATKVEVKLQSELDYVQLVIRDNGRGFSIETAPESGMGMSIMRERAKEILADLEVTSKAGEGTQVSVMWRNHEPV